MKIRGDEHVCLLIADRDGGGRVSSRGIGYSEIVKCSTRYRYTRVGEKMRVASPVHSQFDSNVERNGVTANYTEQNRRTVK